MALSSQCNDCGGKGFFTWDVPYYHPDFGKLIPCPNPIHTRDRTSRIANRANLLPDDLKRRLKDIKRNAGNGAMLDACTAFIANPYGFLYIWGGPGNAKSEALIAVVNELNQQVGQVIAVYIKFSQLVEYMRDAFNEGKRFEAFAAGKGDMLPEGTYTQRFDRIRQIPILAIDEFEKIRDTAFAAEFRFDFIDERYHLALHGRAATLFASNAAPTLLPEPIYDRVRDGRFVIVHNTAPSARPMMKREEDHAA